MLRKLFYAAQFVTHPDEINAGWENELSFDVQTGETPLNLLGNLNPCWVWLDIRVLDSGGLAARNSEDQ